MKLTKWQIAYVYPPLYVPDVCEVFQGTEKELLTHILIKYGRQEMVYREID